MSAWELLICVRGDQRWGVQPVLSRDVLERIWCSKNSLFSKKIHCLILYVSVFVANQEVSNTVSPSYLDINDGVPLQESSALVLVLHVLLGDTQAHQVAGVT